MRNAPRNGREIAVSRGWPKRSLVLWDFDMQRRAPRRPPFTWRMRAPERIGYTACIVAINRYRIERLQPVSGRRFSGVTWQVSHLYPTYGEAEMSHMQGAATALYVDRSVVLIGASGSAAYAYLGYSCLFSHSETTRRHRPAYISHNLFRQSADSP